jgi:vancomycin aglycone glucosyltransferase
MRVLLSTYGSRGDVEPMVGVAAQSRVLGAEVRVCAPPDFAELLAGVGVSLVPTGRPVRPPVTGATPPSAAEECDAPVATGVLPTGGWR